MSDVKPRPQDLDRDDSGAFEYASEAAADERDSMDNFTAVMIAEGVEPADEERQLQAWQHLVNTGLAWQLQGSFGRQAQRMIEAGLIEARS